jgi:hypothetical protein
MRFFRTSDPKEAAMPDIASPDPVSTPPDDPYDSMKGGISDADEFAKPADTGTRLQAPPTITDDREDCPVCHGTGKTLRCADYLAELAAMLPTDDPAALDTIIADFYGRLVGTDTMRGAAPHLRVFFPADLTTGDALNSKGNRQRDQLLTALVALITRYDPDHPHSEGMESLRTNAQTWGRSHSAWWNPDTGEVYYPTPDDYLAVRNVLVNLLADGLGDKLTPKHVAALARAYHSVSTWMQAAADEWRMEHPTPVAPRRPRSAVSR